MGDLVRKVGREPDIRLEFGVCVLECVIAVSFLILLLILLLILYRYICLLSI